MAGTAERKQNSNGNTPSKKGDPDDIGSRSVGKGKPSRPARSGYNGEKACVSNSAHSRWK